jgi:hypothetical protein
MVEKSAVSLSYSPPTAVADKKEKMAGRSKTRDERTKIDHLAVLARGWRCCSREVEGVASDARGKALIRAER